jgi:putative acetyltransferase
MDITFSPLTASDLDEVLGLWSTTDGVGLNESDTPDRVQCFLERNPGLSVVARDGARLVGAVLCGHDGRRGYPIQTCFALWHAPEAAARLSDEKSGSTP